MSEIKFLLKFGKSEHLEDFAAGKLFCSNAITFWGIEKEQKIKGQGDLLEAGSKMFVQRMEMKDFETDKIIFSFGKSVGLVHYEPAEKIPVFCLFAVYEDDCILGKDGLFHISLSAEKETIIRKHFPKADSVAVISKPGQFLADVENSIGFEIKHDFVSYFHIDQGFETTDGINTALDMEYMMYLTQDVPPEIVNGNTVYSFNSDYVYRVLFCKDVFFVDEQEYRIVIPGEKIDTGTNYPVQIQEKINVIPLSTFFTLPLDGDKLPTC